MDLRAQSAIEFLTTYAMMFMVLAFVIVIALVIASSTNKYIPATCTSFGGVSCSEVIFFSNTQATNSILTMVFQNTQSVPVNVVGLTVYINNVSYTTSPTSPICLPSFINAGQVTSCKVSITYLPAVGSAQTGSYAVRVNYCNSEVGQLTSVNCIYSYNAIYTGAFTAYASVINITLTTTTTIS